MNREQERLDKIAAFNSYDKGLNAKMIEYTANLFMRHMKKGNVLELGPAQGLATDIFYNYYPDYTVVDAASIFIDDIRKRHPAIKGFTSLFENFESVEKYDNIIMSHILEHVEDPVILLKKCKSWLNRGGVILIAVPNANSLHRLAGVKLNILSSSSDLHEGDLRIGHRRVYNMDMLVNDVVSAGLSVEKKGGYWLKPISNAQIENNWSNELVNAYMELGEDFPEIACNIYVVAEV